MWARIRAHRHPPLEGSRRAKLAPWVDAKRRGGVGRVGIAAPRTIASPPHPVSHFATLMRADPPPPGEGKNSAVKAALTIAATPRPTKMGPLAIAGISRQNFEKPQFMAFLKKGSRHNGPASKLARRSRQGSCPAPRPAQVTLGLPIYCLSMISGQTLRVCPEGKPVSTFPDHALSPADRRR
jgi:hypothetical protein